jgi:dolichol-phosphate mannosyltransferase
MASPRVLVAVATYNEMDNLPGLVDAIHRTLQDADVLVVDDNSPDGTGKWCDEHSRIDRQLKCHHRSGKQGLGSATLTALKFALDESYDIVVTMDADWSHDPRSLPELVRAIDDADVSVGSRYCPSGAIEGWPIPRRVLSRGMNRLTRFILRLPVRDTSGAFRAYRVAALRKIDLAMIRSTGYAYLEEILWVLHRAGSRMVEVPITFRERRAGQSKITMKEAVGKLRTLTRLALSRFSR